MSDGTINQFEILAGNGSSALRPPRYVDNLVLAANVAESVTIPADALLVNMAGTANFYVDYITDADLNSSGTEELVVNGAFASDTSWTKGTGWTIAAGVASSDGSQTGNADLEQSAAAVNASALGLIRGRSYEVTFTVSAYTAGNVRPVIGGTTGTNRASAATFTETIVAGSTDVIALRADLDFVGSVDNFSVKPVATVPAADSSYGGGVELNPTLRIVSQTYKMSIISGSNSVVSLAYYS